jgi:hypothetical protein
MLRMLHRSSGRDNFGVVKPNNKNEPVPSQQQISGNQATTIQQQTGEAIKVATDSNNPNDNNNQNPK